MSLIARLALDAMAVTATVPAPAIAGETASSPAPSATPPACATAPHRQFDFWLGPWEVTHLAGKLACHSRIESILGGCVLLENWDSPSGVSGKSFNIFNADIGQWEQFWVDNSGSRLHLRGGLEGAKMVLRGVQDKPNAQTGRHQHERISWTPHADGSVRQHWETSTDEGKTWATSFDGLYRRAPAQEK